MIAVNNKILKFWFDKLGLDANYFASYEDSSKTALKNLDALANNLHIAFINRDKIVIASDFDTDGIMSGIIGYSGLSELGFNVSLYEPKPDRGYGLSVYDVEQIRLLHPDVSAILTADVGITANSAINYARDCGIKVWVTDHHLAADECNADVTVNPNQLGESYDQPGICGAFVLYKVLEAYATAYNPSKLLNIYCLRLFAGIAAVADVMPLTGENRQLVRDSATILQSLYSEGCSVYQSGSESQSAFSGIVSLLKHFSAEKKLRSANSINEEFFGFYLIPLLNATKRMGGDMRGVYDVFFDRSESAADAVANNLRVCRAISYISDLNDTRKTMTAAWLAHIVSNQGVAEHGVYITEAPAGIHGLLAMQLMNLSGMPTLVLKHNPDSDSYYGSGRSPGWFHFPNEIKTAGLELSAAGHAGAFGVRCPSTQALNEYCTFYERVVVKAQARAASDIVAHEIVIRDNAAIGLDCDFEFDAKLIREFLDEYESFRPWGAGFKPPKFKLYLNSGFKPKMFGDKLQHAKFITDDSLEVLLFNKAYMLTGVFGESGHTDGVICVTGHFTLNVFNGVESLNFFADTLTKTERVVVAA